MSGILSPENTFIHQVGKSVQLIGDGPGRYRISVPFTFNDGDSLAIVLKQLGDQWVFSDEGHTYMHLAYSIEAPRLEYGTRRQMIVQALHMFQVQERGGELVFPVEYNDYAEALWSFVQALLKIIDVTYLTQERVRSTFLEDFRTFFETMIAPERRAFDWYDAEDIMTQTDAMWLIAASTASRIPYLFMHLRMMIVFVMRRLGLAILLVQISSFILWAFLKIKPSLIDACLLASLISVTANSRISQPVVTLSRSFSKMH